MLADTAHLVIAILLGGNGLIFLYADRHNAASRALAWCFIAAGLATVPAPAQHVSAGAMVLAMFSQVCETLALLFGVEVGIRISRSGEARGRIVRAGAILLRVCQLILLIFGLLSVGYILIFPEYAVLDPDGLVKVRAVEFAVFAPLLGTAMLIAGIALILLILTHFDPVERGRFHALLAGGPMFLFTMMISEQYEPLLMALGMLIIMGGSVRYLLAQAQRGQAMRQFLSPELASKVNLQGMPETLRRERREISVVACDLRGFTAFARESDSDQVVSLLEKYYAKAGQAAAEYGGTVKDHAGDGVLILVGATSGTPDHARRAVNLAQSLMQKVQPLLQETPQPQGVAGLGLGIGISTGEATLGAIQGAGRLEYVAVGNVVNLAARLCDRAANGEILLDVRARELAGMVSSSQNRGAEPMKGYAEAIPFYALTGHTRAEVSGENAADAAVSGRELSSPPAG